MTQRRKPPGRNAWLRRVREQRPDLADAAAIIAVAPNGRQIRWPAVALADQAEQLVADGYATCPSHGGYLRRHRPITKETR